MQSVLVNAHPPLVHLGASLSFFLGVDITCTKNLDLYFNCSDGFEGLDFHSLFLTQKLD